MSREVFEIEGEGFFGEEVDGDGVVAEGVDDQEIVGGERSLFFQGDSSVSFGYFYWRRGVAEVLEIVFGNVDILGVELVKVEGGVFLSVGCQGSHSGSNDALGEAFFFFGGEVC